MRRRTRIAGVLAVLALVGASCGDDGTDFDAACAAWSAWLGSGDADHLEDFVSSLGDDEQADAIDDAIDALDDPTDTADQQAAHEGAVDFISSELESEGCELD